MTWVTPSVVGLGVGVAFLLFRIAFRGRVEETAARYDPAELEARWGRFSRVESLIGLAVVLGGGGGGTVLLGKALHGWAERGYAARPGFVHHLSFEWYYWAIVAAPVVIFFLVAGGVGVYKAILGERFAEYRAYTILKYRYDTLKVAAWMVTVLLPLGIAGIVLGADRVAGATDREVVIDGYFSFEERRYAFEGVAAITERIRVRKKGWSRSYRLEFDEGTAWTSDQVDVAPEAGPPAFVAYVARRSGRTVEREYLGEEAR